MIDVVLISGLPGSGKGKLTHALADKFRWEYLSAGDMWRDQHVEYLKERKLTETQLSFPEYWRSRTLDEQRRMDRLIRQRIEKGKVAGDFRYTQLAEGLIGLRIFIEAPLEIRAQRAFGTERYFGKIAKEIEGILEGRESDEVRTGRELYGVGYDFRDKSRYDLILDSSKLSIEEEVEVVMAELKAQSIH